jgi:hypothetical protein
LAARAENRSYINYYIYLPKPHDGVGRFEPSSRNGAGRDRNPSRESEV